VVISRVLSQFSCRTERQTAAMTAVPISVVWNLVLLHTKHTALHSTYSLGSFLWKHLFQAQLRHLYLEVLVSIRDVKRTSNLRTSKFIFEFGILTFDICVKFALEQMWALKCLRTRCDVFVLCRRLTPAASPADCHGLRRRCWRLITPPASAPYF